VARSSFHLTGRLRYQAGPWRRSFASLGLDLTGPRLPKRSASQNALVNPAAFRWQRYSRRSFSGGIPGISSPGMRSTSEERRSWRCVGRRREEPAARRRATNGPFCVAFIRWGEHPHATLEVHEAPCPISSITGLLFRGDRPGSRRVTAPGRRVGPARQRSQASAFVKTLQTTLQRRLVRERSRLLARSRCESLLSIGIP